MNKVFPLHPEIISNHSFSCEGALTEHDLEVKLDIGEPDPGDSWTPPSGPEIDIETVKVNKPCDDGSRPYYYRCLIYMVHTRKDKTVIKRLLPAQVAYKVADYLHEEREDDILEEASGQRECEMDDAADDRRKGYNEDQYDR